MATNEELTNIFLRESNRWQVGDRETRERLRALGSPTDVALRAVYNAGLSRAAEIIAASTPNGRDAFTPSVTFGRIIAAIEAEKDQA